MTHTPDALDLMPEAMKIEEIKELRLEVASLKGRILEAIVEFETIEAQNAQLLEALEEKNTLVTFANEELDEMLGLLANWCDQGGDIWEYLDKRKLDPSDVFEQFKYLYEFRANAEQALAAAKNNE